MGRDRELGHLNDLLRSAKDGAGALALIAGRPGIGKTAVVHQLMSDARDHGFVVLAGRSYERSIDPHFGAWIEAFEGYQDAVVPPSLPVPSLGNPSTTPSEQLRMYREVRAFLQGLATELPTLIVLEDLDWADEDSIRLLRYVGHRASSMRVLIVATHRPPGPDDRGALAHHLPELVREWNVARIELDPLRESDMRRLLRSLYHLSAVEEDQLTRLIFDRSEGIPFYFWEFLHQFEAEGALHRVGDRWAFTGQDDLPVPELVRRVANNRLNQMERGADLIRVASVIGPVVPFDLWQRASSASVDALVEAAERAVEAGLVEMDVDSDSIHFTHNLMRESIYQGIMRPRRRSWHRRVAEVLTGDEERFTDLCADHLMAAGDADALPWVLRSADRAQSANDWRAAASRLESALSIMERAGAPAVERGWLCFRIGMLRRHAEPGRAFASLHEASRHSAGSSDRLLHAFSEFEIGHVMCALGEYGPGIEQMERGVDLIEQLPDEDLDRVSELTESHHSPHEISPWATLAVWMAQVGRFRDAERLVHRAIEALSSWMPGADHPAVRADIEFAMGIIHAANGEPERSRHAFDRAVMLYQQIDHVVMAAVSLSYGLRWRLLPYHADQLRDRREYVLRLYDQWHRVRETLLQDVASAEQVPLMIVEGRWQEADVALSSSGVLASSWLPTFRALLALERGEIDVLEDEVRRVFPQGPATKPGGTWYYEALGLQRLTASAAASAGDFDSARSWLDAQSEWLEFSGAVLGRAEYLCAQASFEYARGNLELAAQIALHALASAEQPRQPLPLIHAHQIMADLLIDRHDIDVAQRHIAQALTLADSSGASVQRARTLVSLARLRRSRGELDSARVALDEAEAVFQNCNALASLTTIGAIRAEIDSVGAQPPASEDPEPSLLSPRESHVLALLAAGKSNAQIADELSISVRTAERHLTNIYTKINATSRAEAIAYAHRHRID